MTRSRYLSVETRHALAEQLRCAECGESGPFEKDHHCPHALGGSNDIENIRHLCIGCHGKKTAKDRRMIAKANRLRKGPKQRKGRAMRSRGFDKTLRKRFNGRL